MSVIPPTFDRREFKPYVNELPSSGKARLYIHEQLANGKSLRDVLDEADTDWLTIFRVKQDPGSVHATDSAKLEIMGHTSRELKWHDLDENLHYYFHTKVERLQEGRIYDRRLQKHFTPTEINEVYQMLSNRLS